MIDDSQHNDTRDICGRKDTFTWTSDIWKYRKDEEKVLYVV